MKWTAIILLFWQENMVDDSAILAENNAALKIRRFRRFSWIRFVVVDRAPFSPFLFCVYDGRLRTSFGARCTATLNGPTDRLSQFCPELCRRHNDEWLSFSRFSLLNRKKVSEKPKQMWKVLDKLKQFHRKLMVSQDKLLFRINYSCWAIVRGRNFLLRLPTKRCEKVEDGSLGSDKKDLRSHPSSHLHKAQWVKKSHFRLLKLCSF